MKGRENRVRAIWKVAYQKGAPHPLQEQDGLRRYRGVPPLYSRPYFLLRNIQLQCIQFFLAQSDLCKLLCRLSFRSISFMPLLGALVRKVQKSMSFIILAPLLSRKLVFAATIVENLSLNQRWCGTSKMNTTRFLCNLYICVGVFSNAFSNEPH